MAIETFWGGKHKEAVSALQKDIPLTGACQKDRPALEAWRKLQNGYYDLYNNGGCNWHIRGADFRASCKFAGMKPPSKQDIFDWSGNISGAGKIRLEEVADAVFLLALIEKVSLP